MHENTSWNILRLCLWKRVKSIDEEIDLLTRTCQNPLVLLLPWLCSRRPGWILPNNSFETGKKGQFSNKFNCGIIIWVGKIYSMCSNCLIFVQFGKIKHGSTENCQRSIRRVVLNL